jgi:NADH:ubiquinone oxidoreductase subunit 11 or 4L (chain K)
LFLGGSKCQLDIIKSFHGQIFSFMVMCVAVAEVSVGLAIIIALHRNKPTVNLDEFNLLKW